MQINEFGPAPGMLARKRAAGVGTKVILGIAVLVGGSLAALLVYILVSGRNFADRVEHLREAMIASQQMSGPARGDIPQIMRRYALRAGGTTDGPCVFHARHKATLATTKGRPPLLIDADQWTGTRIPGLVWLARGSMMGLPVTAVDSYVDGEGMLEARVLSAFRVAGGTGPEFAKGELMRYLSELPVYPDAILNARGLSWRQIDDTTVEVSAPSAGGAAVLRFLFDGNGDIVAMQADDRPMMVGDETVPTPWHGIYGAYKQFGRYRIPSYGEVGWVLADGLFTYWKGEVVAYEPAQQPG